MNNIIAEEIGLVVSGERFEPMLFVGDELRLAREYTFGVSERGQKEIRLRFASRSSDKSCISELGCIKVSGFSNTTPNAISVILSIMAWEDGSLLMKWTDSVSSALIDSSFLSD